ncbi:unnamed protein product [Mycena citricolor]|uniref:BTB domain-containing protein n=1 Tax=Mycena citricolor TaxID=2018698 RepID=A0AAD2HR21_9AGAR|nr:unnamed protein product [Mycena citricolor]
MSLSRIEEKWSASSIQSTLQLIVPSQTVGDTYYSPACGLGWRFYCSVQAVEFGTPPLPSDVPVRQMPWRRVTIFFEPFLLRSATFGRLSITASCDKLLSPLTDEVPNNGGVNVMDLPSRSNFLMIGNYMLEDEDYSPLSIVVNVNLPSTAALELPSSGNASGNSALSALIRGEEQIDFMLLAYSRVQSENDERVATGIHPLFAKLSVLKGCSERLDDCGFPLHTPAVFLTARSVADLDACSSSSAFSESQQVDLDLFEPSAKDEKFPDYDYMSDSDLDDDGAVSVPTPVMIESTTSGSASAAELQRETTLPSADGSSGDTVATTLPACKREHKPATSSRGRMGHVLVDKSHASLTWNALFYYLYTGNISFRRLGEKIGTDSDIPRCSAKSMYKLADKFDLADLKTRSMNFIKGQLSPENIVHEAFSTFTSLFEEIQAIEVQYLMTQLKTPGVSERMADMIDMVNNGERRGTVFKLFIEETKKKL